MEGITPTTTAAAPSLTGSLGGTQATQEQFLNLLVTQLRNQDPLEPMKNEDFLTQLATFSQLEEQQKTSRAIQDLVSLQNASLVLGGLSQGANLVGKEVSYLDPETGDIDTGVVGTVTFDPAGVMLTIGDRTVPLGNVVSVGETASPASTNNEEPTGEPEPTSAPTPGTSGPSRTNGAGSRT